MKRLLLVALAAAILIVPMNAGGLSIFGKDWLWSLGNSVRYIEDASKLGKLLDAGTGNADDRDRLLKLKRALCKCGLAECVEIAKGFPGTSLTGPAPTSIADLVQLVIDEWKENNSPRLPLDPKSPQTHNVLVFGDLTRTAYEDSTASLTLFRMTITDLNAEGQVIGGLIEAGDIIEIPDPMFDPALFLFPTPNGPLSTALMEVTSVDTITDSYVMELWGLGADNPVPPFPEIPFIGDFRRMSPTQIRLSGVGIPDTLLVEAGSFCDLTFVGLPVDSIVDPYPFLGDTLSIRDIYVSDGGLTPPYEIRVRATGPSAMSSNELIVVGDSASVADQPFNNCRPMLCVDRSDPDADGYGTPCDNCPGDYNPNQEDTDNDGIGDACDATTSVDDPLSPVRLLRARPNPFSASTRVSFELRQPAHVLLAVFDSQGRVVRVLRDATLGAQTHELSWDGRDDSGRPVPGGVFWIRLETGISSHSHQIIRIP